MFSFLAAKKPEEKKIETVPTPGTENKTPGEIQIQGAVPAGTTTTQPQQGASTAEEKKETLTYAHVAVKKEENVLSQKAINLKIGVIFLCCIFGGIAFSITRYLDQYKEKTVPAVAVANVEKFEGYEQQINSIAQLNNFDAYVGLPKDTRTAKNTIQQIIGANDINYVHKKRLLAPIFIGLIDETVQIESSINAIKNNIGQYGFFNKELADILDQENKVSLQRTLLSLETIKFATALKVFANLETFIDQFSRDYKISKGELATYMAFYSQRAEVDIINYLQACYLNPFEHNEQCGVIKDFDNHFKYYEPETQINLALFKTLFAFMNEKLSDDNFPNFSIKFDRFNPEAQNLSFQIIINTLQENEKYLINQGILNPHIFILTNVINQLKESKFIIGEKIKVDDMYIKEMEIEIGGKQILVHNSSKSFDVPLQKNTQREIFDYIPLTKKEAKELKEQVMEIAKNLPDPTLFEEELQVDLEIFGKEQNKSGTEEGSREEIGSGTITPGEGEKNEIITGTVISTGTTSETGGKE